MEKNKKATKEHYHVIIRSGLNLLEKESKRTNEKTVLCVVVDIDALLKP